MPRRMESLFCTFVFILASTAKVINDYRPINVVSQPGIEPGTFEFQDSQEVILIMESGTPRYRSTSKNSSLERY